MECHKGLKGSLGTNAMIGIALALIVAFMLLQIWTDAIPVPISW